MHMGYNDTGTHGDALEKQRWCLGTDAVRPNP